MTQDSQDSQDSYKVTGCVLFITEDEAHRKGYQESIDVPVSLIYQVEGSDLMYYKNEETFMKILYAYLVETRYTIEQAREIYPELFL